MLDPPTHPILDARYWILDPPTRPGLPADDADPHGKNLRYLRDLRENKLGVSASRVFTCGMTYDPASSSIEHRVSSIENRVSRIGRAPAALSLSVMKRALELWLVRHGESVFSATKRVAGWSNPPLTDNGRRQAEALRSVIDGRRFVGVWSSDLERAVESARLAWGEPRTDQRLRECNFGELEGCTYEEADSTYGEVFHEFRGFQAPGGESHEDFRARVFDFVGALEPGRHLLFVHGGVIRVLSQDLGVDRFIPTGSLLGLDWGAGKVSFVREAGNTDDRS
jgi:probable phosphoglycerate mutase